MTPREIVVLGSTGSVGMQALDVARAHPESLRVVGLGAGGGNPAMLAEQALEFGVEAVAVAKAGAVQDLQLAFFAAADRRGWIKGDFALPKIVAGPEAMEELAGWRCHTVLNAVTGSVGLRPTLAALRAGRVLALANKESLVAGGPLVREVAAPGQIVPVDSEHSALAQCMRAGERRQLRRLILTATGGPFRGRSRAELSEVTLEQALKHPAWDMGPVVTINSATMMNKALEVIEAHELFDVPYEDVEVTVHPQAYVHSLAEFRDGSTIAQVSPPDMKLPIAHALVWPDRLDGVGVPVDWRQAHSWQFEPLDEEAFPAVSLARAAGRAGGCLPAVFNAANEEAVAAFVAGRLSYLGIVDLVRDVVEEAPEFDAPGTVEDVLAAEEWARSQARQRAEKR